MNKRVTMKIKGMTCAGCEGHVAEALKQAGAAAIQANFRRGEAIFELPEGIDVEKAKEAINDTTGYTAGEAEVAKQSEGVPLGDDGDYDLIIIGSGGAAFSAAIKATDYGAKVAMVERGTIGGTCVNIGCVPSKTMLRSGEINHLAKNNPFLGLNTSAGSVDLKKLVEQKDDLVEALRQKKYIDLIDEYGFDVIKGEAKFVDDKTIDVDGRQLTAKKFLIATGASPSVPNISGLDEVDYLTSTTLLELTELPRSLAVIGSGYIGLELGQLFHNLGVEVTLMQRSERLLKDNDPEISETVEKALTEQGLTMMTGATYDLVEQKDGVKKVHVTVGGKKKVIEAEQLLVATGRTPNTKALNLGAAHVELGSRGEIVIDDFLKTSNPRIYAAGDVTLGPQFVYVAAYEGGVVADNIFGGQERKINLEAVPGVIFTKPGIATVGLTEDVAKQKGYEVKTSVLPLDAVPRALANHDTTGVFKIVAEAGSLKVLGVHVVAEHAGDVIYAATLAVKYGITVEDLKDSFAPYLTMAEGLKLAALTFDKDVNKLSCCAG